MIKGKENLENFRGKLIIFNRYYVHPEGVWTLRKENQLGRVSEFSMNGYYNIHTEEKSENVICCSSLSTIDYEFREATKEEINSIN